MAGCKPLKRCWLAFADDADEVASTILLNMIGSAITIRSPNIKDDYMDYFDEIADMMSKSKSVGPYATREQIIDSLHNNFKSENDLRIFVEKIMKKAESLIDEAKNNDETVFIVINNREKLQ